MLFRATLIAFLLSTTVTATAAAQPPPNANAIDGLFADAGDPAGPGCAISVARNGVPLLERVFGLADLEQPSPIRPDTIFEAGSVSKQFAAAALAVLISEGRLSLDDDIRRSLPEMRDYGSPITVRMLLTHTSGLRNWDDLVELNGDPRGERSYDQDEILALIARQSALNFAPGSEYLYSNSNYVLAAVIAARVSGESFAAFSQRALFDPAGMSRTSWRDDHNRVVPGRATAYTRDEAGVLRIDMPGEDVVGPGGLLTTVGDLQRWNAFLDQPPAAAASWVALMLETRGVLADGTPIAYGMGLESETVSGQPVISHAGATAGYRTYLARAPQDRLSVALLCNAGALNTEDLGPEVMALYLPPPPNAGSAPAPSGSAADAGLAGGYRNNRTFALVTVTVDEAGLSFNGGPPFRAKAPDLLVNAAATRQVHVARDRSGSVASLKLTRIGNSAVLLTPVAAWSPDMKALQAFAGTYHSEDVDASWTVAMDGASLRATGPSGETFLLDPLYANTFAARDNYWIFAFNREGRGKAASISMFKTRTRGVVFKRSR
jgi:CubicO group peptidase (beta-lactamase class C family)